MAVKIWKILQRIANKQWNGTSSSNKLTRSKQSIEVKVIEVVRKSWKDAWYTFFDENIGKIFYKTYQSKGGRSIFANVRFVNIKVLHSKIIHIVKSTKG